jgi:hypothetical protein
VSTTPPPIRQARRSTAPRSGSSGHHARPDEHVVLDYRAAGEVNPGLDQDPGADLGPEVDRGSATHNRSRADRRALAYLGLVADDHPLSYARAGVDHGAGAYRDVRSQDERLGLSCDGPRAASELGALAQHGAVLDQAPLAEDRAGVEHRA